MSSSGQSSPMESSGGACSHGEEPAPAVRSSSEKLWRGMQAAYLVLVKKHQTKLAALGHLLSSSKRRHRRRRSSLAGREQNPALVFLSSSLSCRSMDPAAAVVHPYPRGHGHGHRRASSSSSSSRHAAAPSLSCRSMDPASAVCSKYQYRPREVEFSCKSTPMHKRRRENKRRLRQQQQQQSYRAAAAADHPSSEPEPEHYGSAAAVTRLFALMDVEEVAEAADHVVVYYDDDGDLDQDLDLDAPAAAGWSAAPRQVRITDSPYLAREQEDNDELRSAVDRRADEFITWFHEQLRTQQQQHQQQQRSWVR